MTSNNDAQHQKDSESASLSRRNFLTGASAIAAGSALLANQQAKSAGPVGRPKTMLVKNAEVLVTMDKDRREIKNGGMYIEDGVIKQVDSTDKLPKTAEYVIDMKGHVVLPGLVNTHHHLYQHLTRVAPACQDGNVWNWLKVLYPMWAKMTPDSESF